MARFSISASLAGRSGSVPDVLNTVTTTAVDGDVTTVDTDVTAVAADVATLVADGATPTQAHVNTLNTDWGTLNTDWGTLKTAWTALKGGHAAIPSAPHVVLSFDAVAVGTKTRLRALVAEIMRQVESGVGALKP